MTRRHASVAARRLGPLALCLTVLPLFAAEAGAEVRSTTETRHHTIRGESAGELVTYLHRHPLPHQGLSAFATLLTEPKLDLAFAESHGGCRVRDVDLNFRFVMTLPRAANEAGMSRTTRAQWREFHAFAKRHEEAHRAIYLAAGKRFVKEALKVGKGGDCREARRAVDRAFARAFKASEGEQTALDRRDTPRVYKLPLFRAALR